MQSPSGYGHTIKGADVARRLFHGEKLVFLIFSAKRSVHNPSLAKLWSDVRVCYLPRFPLLDEIRFRPLIRRWDGMARWVLRMFVRMFAKKTVEVMGIMDLYRCLPVCTPLAAEEEKELDEISPTLRYVYRYVGLIRSTPLPPLRLPASDRRLVSEILARKSGVPVSRHRICCLYLRQKDADTKERTNTNVRNGSGIESYLPALRELVDAGYQVLVTGDEALPAAILQAFDGMVLDAENSTVERSLFSLYAASECEFFIGEAGGGVWLPCACGIPILLTNFLPIYAGIPNSTVMFKSIRDRDGEEVPLETLFKTYPFEYKFDEWTIQNNSPEELREGIVHFISSGDSTTCMTAKAEKLAGLLPRHTLFRESGARMSPAWLAHHS